MSLVAFVSKSPMGTTMPQVALVFDPAIPEAMGCPLIQTETLSSPPTQRVADKGVHWARARPGQRSIIPPRISGRRTGILFLRPNEIIFKMRSLLLSTLSVFAIGYF